MVVVLRAQGPQPLRNAEAVRSDLAAIVLSEPICPFMRIWPVLPKALGLDDVCAAAAR